LSAKIPEFIVVFVAKQYCSSFLLPFIYTVPNHKELVPPPRAASWLRACSWSGGVLRMQGVWEYG